MEHEHEWILVTNFGDTRLMRFCQQCPERQMLTPDDWQKELEQKIAQLQYLYGKQVYPKEQELADALDLLREALEDMEHEDWSDITIKHKIRAFLAGKEVRDNGE